MIIFFTEHFKNQLKYLKKKYPHIKDDVLKVLEEFDPHTSTTSIGRSIYKERIPCRDMNKGKSGGFRTYIYCLREEETIVPFAIHTKSNIEQLSGEEIQYHFDQMTLEIEGK